MNEYERKRNWKIFLLLFAVAIGFFSLWYTSRLVKKLAAEEEKKVEQWAEATKLIVSTGFMEDFSSLRTIDSNQYLNLDKLMGEVNNFLSNIQQHNVTIPVILTDEHGQINSHRNLDPAKEKDSSYLKDQLEIMRSEHPPIVIEFFGNQKNYIWYKNSLLLSQLKYYPYFQLSIIALFILVSYLAFSASRRSEQDRVWVGMSRETAHQLGTPISSIMAWLDMLRQNEREEDRQVHEEMAHDLKRLEVITERFSKIGSAPVMESRNLVGVVNHFIKYLQPRTSSKVKFELKSDREEMRAQVNIPLFEWVIENLCKNAIDAMNGEGKLSFRIHEDRSNLFIDISDTGKGIPKSKFKTVFKPGFTTKKRGWGLGLSLVKRIMEDYHRGHILVLHSEMGKGTTFRITLKK